MMYAYSDMECLHRHNFCHFRPLFAILPHYWPRKLKFGKNVKKTPGDIILLHMCTINQDHMMYGSYDMKFNRQNFFVFLGNFLSFYSLTSWKMKIPKRKKTLGISSFYTSVQKIMIIHYTVPEIWRMTDVIVIFILGYTFPFYPPNNPKN